MNLSNELLTDYVLDLSIDDLPSPVIEQAEKLTLDTVACAVGAYASPPSKILRRMYGDATTGEQLASVFGDGRTIRLEYASLINGTMGRYLDFNECYTTGEAACHPSDHIPPLISVAEAEGASGADLIEAIVLAFEIQSRGVDTGALWKQGFDYTTWGAYSSVAAVGKLMGLTADQLVSAFGIAGTANNGLMSSRLGELSMWKAMAMPYTTHNAIQACQMTRNGITGPQSVFSGEGGFFEAITDGPIAFDGLGGRDGAGYKIMETSFKSFACGYFTHPSITAVLDLVEGNDIEPDEIESVDIETFDLAVQVYANGPEKWERNMTRETADHSLPYNVSVAVMDGEVTPRQYDKAHRTSDAVYELMQTVTVEENEEINEYRREHPRHVPAIATIEADGESYRTRVNAPRGHPERPMSDEELETKATGLVEPYLGDAQTDALIDLCEDLSELDQVETIVPHLTV